MFPEASGTSVVNVTKGFQFQDSHIFIGEGGFPIPRPPKEKAPPNSPSCFTTYGVSATTLRVVGSIT
jgi:hypothetical protein